MATRFKHRPTCVIPVAAEQAVNDYLERQGLGRCFSIPLVIGPTDELIQDSESRITHYGTTLAMTDGMNAMLDRLLSQHAGQRVEKKFAPALTEIGAKRDFAAHPYQVIAIIRQADRKAIIDEIAKRFPTADTRFFLTGLSASGIAPATHRLGRWKVNDAAIPLIRWIADNVPRMEILVAGRNGGNGAAMRAAFDLPKYKIANAGTRANARVWLKKDWTLADVLALTGLKLIPQEEDNGILSS